MFQIVRHVNASTMWANIHLLFWLSLIPFVTAWSGENHFAPIPVALYGFVLFMCANAYYILVRALVASHPLDSEINRAFKKDIKGKLSSVLCGISVALAFFYPYVSLGIYTLIAAIWLIPDTRVEEAIHQKN